MASTVLIVTYDIPSDRRRTTLFKCLRGWGDHLQYSVFRVVVGKKERVLLSGQIEEIINNKEDQVLIVDLGPDDGRGAQAIAALGMPYTHPERPAVVL